MDGCMGLKKQSGFLVPNNYLQLRQKINVQDSGSVHRICKNEGIYRTE